jgi:hypothetical protein
MSGHVPVILNLPALSAAEGSKDEAPRDDPWFDKLAMSDRFPVILSLPALSAAEGSKDEPIDGPTPGPDGGAHHTALQ